MSTCKACGSSGCDYAAQDPERLLDPSDPVHEPPPAPDHERRMLEYARINAILKSNPEAREVLAHFMRRTSKIRVAQIDPFHSKEDWYGIADSLEARAGQLERGENLK